MTQRNSLRDFFISELESDLQVINDHPTTFSLSFQVRHMITTTFPSLVINSVRILQSDPEFLPDYFSSMMNILHGFQQEARVDLNLQFITALQIYEQFCTDLQVKCMDGSILTGNRAQVTIGGMMISIDLNNIS